MKFSAAFVACCFVAAGLVVASASWQGMPDPDHYRIYAERYSTVFSGRPAWPDAHRSPFYPLVLSPIVYFAERPVPWIVALHVALTIAILAAVWQLAKKSSSGAVLAVVACLFVSVDPILVFQSGQIMTETIFTALLLWALLPWIDVKPVSQQAAAVSGVLVGLAFLTRPAMAPIFIAVGFAQLVRGNWIDLRRWALASLTALCIALPWALHNKLRWDHAVFTTTHGGYTLWLANNPSFFEVEVVGGRNWAGSSEFETWQDDNLENAPRWSNEQDDFYRNAAVRWIADNPKPAAQAAVYRLTMFWGLQPRTGPASLRPVIGIYYSIFFLLALHGWFLTKSWRGPWLTATLVVIALSAVHTIYWSNMRFRAPIEPLLAIWAAKSLESLWRSFRPAT